MLAVENLSKRFGSQILFQNAAFSIGTQERIGVVGPNGAGKSTFFKILMGQEDVDSGKIHIPNQYRINLMKQEWHPPKGKTVLEASLSVFEPWTQAKDWMLEVAASLEDDPDQLTKYQEAEDAFLALGGYQVENEIKEILTGLGFESSQFDQIALELSGGWRMRCYLAGLLVQKSDLLLLDEPTNHLDIDSVIWFENFLQTYPYSIMLISHDRRLVQTIANKILEFSPPKLTLWPGGLKKFESSKEERMEQLEKEMTHKEREMDKLKNFARRFGAKATKARQAQNKLRSAAHYEDELEKLKSEMPIESVRISNFSLTLNKRQPKICMQIEQAVFGYHKDQPLFSIDQCLVESGKKIGIIGDNGVGKSTFLKTCAGEIGLLEGTCQTYTGAKVSLFGQHRMEELPLSMKALDYLVAESDQQSISHIRSIAASLGLNANDIDKTIQVLSGGEKARVSLARILLQRPDILLLDEPTNHLDLHACDSLIEGLKTYDGTVLVVSHNRDFLDALVDQIYLLEKGQVQIYLGNYQDFEEQKMRLEKAHPQAKSLKSSPKTKSPKKPQESIQGQKTQKQLQKQIDQLDQQMQNFDQEMAEIDGFLADPENKHSDDFAEKLKRRSRLVDKKERAEQQWLELQETLEKG